MDAYKLYQDSLKIIKTSKRQRSIFDYWLNHNSSEPFETMGFDTENTGVTFGVPSIFHTEGTDFKVPNIRVFGISLCIPWKSRLVLVWGRAGTPLYDDCIEILDNEGPKVAHNLRYDMRVCEVNNISLPRTNLHCTLTMARIHWNQRMKFDLTSLTDVVVPELSGYDEELKAIMRNIRSSYTRNGYPKDYCNYSFLPDEVISKYSMADSFVCWLLNLILHPYIQRDHKTVYTRERKVIPMIVDVENRGFQFDRRRAMQEIRVIQRRLPFISRKLIKIAGKRFNPYSPKQVLPVLLHVGIPKKLLMKVVKKKKKITTEKPVLERALLKIKKPKAHKFVETLLELRKYSKLLNTYLLPLYYRAGLNNGIIYGNINPTDTRTGRMSSSDPNLQNIPRPRDRENKYNPVRKCFICRPGYDNYFFDYSQMEMWIFALAAGEKKMLKILKSGEDIHGGVAKDLYGKNFTDEQRQDCKSVNFGIIYGEGFKALSLDIRKSEMFAHDLKNEYLETYPAISEFFKKCQREINRQGFVKDIFGRRYNIDPRKAYKAVNGIVQGGCAQILKIALLNTVSYIEDWGSVSGLRIHILLPLHDELIIEVPKDVNARKILLSGIVKRMSEIPQLKKRGIILPVTVKKSTKSWEDKEAA